MVVEPAMIMTHGSPLDPDEYVFRSSQLPPILKYLQDNKIEICFHGHTHIPGVYDDQYRHYYSIDEEIQLTPGKCYLINPGSIGQPRDRNPMASYCEYDTDLHQLVFRRYEYDIESTIHAIIEKGLPEDLGLRLLNGL
jgi:diadenosine tetraphosphatase ApaH/serine/threonine PP2A family protein phosphatase